MSSYNLYENITRDNDLLTPRRTMIQKESFNIEYYPYSINDYLLNDFGNVIKKENKGNLTNRISHHHAFKPSNPHSHRVYSSSPSKSVKSPSKSVRSPSKSMRTPSKSVNY